MDNKGLHTALLSCSMCDEAIGVLINQKLYGDAPFKGKRHVHTGEICETCEKKVADNVSFLCADCGSVTVVDLVIAQEEIEVSAGDKYRIQKCDSCTKGQGLLM